jgi:hypothetical protein
MSRCIFTFSPSTSRTFPSRDAPPINELYFLVIHTPFFLHKRYLKINSPFSDPNTDQISNTYDLSWETQTISSVTDEFEDNDTRETATDIRNLEGNYFTDLLLIDEDWYQIEATSRESWLRLNYEIGSSANPVTFNLYDEENNFP